ncbi:hypothetical protein [Pseudoalteromonas rubra]|uniref:HEAT repeat domain-containing protein n=1 Tax=Pseudoalteromonas rubra TaxID=43658 RepID=A0A0U3I9U3_9GAMM|nr:hypothetical protein [Pseudoalteromonas rubra]ALU44831.1 hypothetical protein AT705_18885 [Pseudoalteromonas rubra]
MSKVAFIAVVSLVIHGLIALNWVTPATQPITPNNHTCHSVALAPIDNHVVQHPMPTDKNNIIEQSNVVVGPQTAQLASVPSAHLISQSLTDLKDELNKRFAYTEQPLDLLTLTEQALLLKQPKVLMAHTNKILNQAQVLDAQLQEDLLISLENILQPEHLDALIPYLTSQHEDVQEEALVRLLEIKDAPQIEQHLSYLANYGLTLWVREEADKQLNMLHTRLPVEALPTD